MPMSFILRAPPLLSFVFIRMRVIADKPTILPTEANFSKKEFVFSKDKNLPINRMLKAKKQVCMTVWAGITPLLLVVYVLRSGSK